MKTVANTLNSYNVDSISSAEDLKPITYRKSFSNAFQKDLYLTFSTQNTPFGVIRCLLNNGLRLELAHKIFKSRCMAFLLK